MSVKFIKAVQWVAISLLCVNSFSSVAAPCGVAGSLSGFIFNDYNGDTVQGVVNIETGVTDITVTVFSDDGSSNSCESLSDGAFSINPAAGGFPVRMEITIPADKDYLFSGVSGPTRVQFFSAADAAIDVGLLNPKEFCDSNPMLATSCFVNGNPELNDGAAGSASLADVLVGFPYNATGNTAATNNSYLALGGEVGATWGLAFQRQSEHLFAASMMKRHVGFAQLGPGGIYQVDMTDPLNPVASDFLDLDDAPYNISFGTDTHNIPTSDPTLATYDEAAWDSVGKVGFGGLAFSEDETTMWTVNLFDRSLYEIPVGIPATAPLPGDINVYPIPDPGCMANAVSAPEDSRPWAVEYYQGMVYVGVTCSGQTSQLSSDLTATLYRFDPDNTVAGFTTVISFPLNYPRGYVSTGAPLTSANWFAWIDNFSDIPNPNQSYGQAIYPQPIFTDLQFDTDGSIIIAFTDRLGHQMGNNNYGNSPSTELHEAAVGGDILRVCYDGSTYTMEDNASCDGGVTSTNGANSTPGQGPGGGEWYWQDMFGISANPDSGAHDEVTIGGVAHLPGSGQVVVSTFDPTDQVRSGGSRWFNNATGETDQEYMIFGTDAGGGATTFGKSAGLGDVELMCPQAPLELGNRLWCDADHDGVQDPSEGTVAGVQVTLQCGVDLPVTTLTSATGNYYFNDVNYDAVNGTPILRNAACTVSVDTNLLANATALNNACGGAAITQVDNGGVGSGSDLRDSDGVDNGAGVVEVSFTSGYAGYNNHSIDFGFGTPTDYGDNPDPTYPTLAVNNGAVHELIIGNTWLGACVDSEFDGQPNAAATGDDAAVGGSTFGVCAVAGDDEDGITDIQNLYVGNGTASLDIEATGACQVDAWIDFNQDGDFNDAGEQIFNNVAAANGANNDVSFAVPAAALSGNTYARFRCSAAGGLTPTGLATNGEVEDYLVNVAPVFTLGDFVWYDSNQDGLQDGGEPGVNGVDVDLYNNATCTGGSINSTSTVNGGLPLADGFYQFTGLPAGPYCVEFSNIPAGYAISPQNVGGNDAIDSDANPGNGQIQSINLTADDPTNDMGISLDGSIAGLTWCESTTNANTVYNAGDGDTLIPNIQVTLYNDSNCNDTVDGADAGTAVTQDTNGTADYLFSNLPVGPVGNAICYITEVDAGDTDLGSCNNLITAQTLGPDLDINNPDSTNNNFGFDEILTLGDFVWYDTNQDGIQDGGEPGVNGVTVELFSNATCTGVADESTNTANGGLPAADGFYQFTSLASGPYCVEFSNIPVGYAISPQNVGANDAIDSDANPGTGQIQNINLTADDPTNDMGISLDGSIAGLTWCESTTNANTAYNAGDGDTLIPNIQVTLYNDANCNDTVDGSDAGTAVTQDTNGTADYLFSNLPVGPVGNAICYITEVDAGDNDLGTCNNLITAQTLGPDLDINNPDSTNNNFGFDENIGLGDYVWYDTNQDGIQDGGEPGVNGVAVALFNNATCTGQAIDVTTTANGGIPAADGFYDFTGLATGPYCVEFSNIPAGYAISPQNVGGNDAIDSDANPGTGQIQNINLTADDPTNDMGISLDGSIAGLTWCESTTNANTVYNAGDGDTLIPNIQVTLYNDANCNDTVDGSDAGTAVTQDTNGTADYLFSNLPVGPVGNAVCYITEVDSADTDLGSCNNLITAQTLGPDLDINNPDSTNNNFGFDENIGLGDFVWYDTNQDGIQNVGEPGVNGVTAELFNNATCTGVAIESTVTANGGIPAADGFYDFANLASGPYCVTFSNIPAGYAISPQNVGGNDAIDSDANPGTGQIQNINLTADDPTNDMGISLDGSIAGLTWCESTTNANTVYNAVDGDTLIPNIQITLYSDANCSDTVDGSEAGSAITQSTDVTGSYLFDDLPVGPVGNALCYITEVDINDTDLNNCNTPITVTLLPPDLDTDNPDSVDNDFGFDDTLELGDYVWYDNNQDGLQDVNEPGVNGITVNLYDNLTCSGAAVDSQSTGNGGLPARDGYYLFPDLDAGNYCVEFTGLPTGYVFTQQNAGDDALDSDANIGNGQVTGIVLSNSDYTIDGGIYAATGIVSGLLFCDTEPRNGIYDTNEEISGVTATLHRDLDCDDIGDISLGSVDTDINGEFEFTGLPVALSPVPPNPAVCYVLAYSQTDPDLGDCSIPVTPETQTVELTEDDPEAEPRIFIVIPRGEIVPVPMSKGAMLILIMLIMLSLLVLNRRQRQ